MRGIDLGIVCCKGAPKNPTDVAALEQSEVERQPRDAGRKADHQVATLPGNAAQCRLGVIAANRIEDDVCPGRSDRLLEQLRQCFLPILVEWSWRINYR